LCESRDNASGACEIVSEAYDGEAVKISIVIW